MNLVASAEGHGVPWDIGATGAKLGAEDQRCRLQLEISAASGTLDRQRLRKGSAATGNPSGVRKIIQDELLPPTAGADSRSAEAGTSQLD